MEEEFGKEYFLTPSIPDKQNLMSHVLIDARLHDKDLETRGVQVVQLGVDSGAVLYGNQSSKFEFGATGFVSAKVHSNGTVNNLAIPAQQDDTSHHSSVEIDGVGLATSTSTPEKQESKKRPNSRIHLNKTPRKKLKKLKPKILDESTKKKTRNDQASEFIPKTPLKRSTPKQRSKRSYVKKTVSKEVSVKKNRCEHVFDLSKDVVQEHLPNSSCKRALKFIEKETQAENVCNPLKVCESRILNLKFDKKEEKQFVKHYQRRVSVKMGDSGVHVGKPPISKTQESIQDTQPSSHAVFEIFETDCLTSIRSDFNIISSFPKLYKRRRNVRHLLYRRPCETRTDDCVKSLPSCPLKWRKKRSPGCTKRRIYASRSVKFKCSSSPSINLLEHLTNEKLHHKLANKRKEMKKRRNKVKPSPKNENVKMIEKYLPQESLFREKDLNVHGFVDFIAKFESLSIHHNFDQLVVRDQSVGASIVPYEGKFNPSKKKKKALVKDQALVKVDLDEESERAWLKLMDRRGKSYEQGSEDEEYWDKERQVMINRVESTISILRGFQGIMATSLAPTQWYDAQLNYKSTDQVMLYPNGNRSFSRWKGSVMDSIIGTYLTQNVSDHISSSVFMCLAARFPVRDRERSNKSHERLSACLPLDLFPNEDAGMQKCGNKSTFQEINHNASRTRSEIESLVIRASITDSQDSEIESFRTKSETRTEKIIGPIFSLRKGYNKRGFPDRKIKKNEEHNMDWDKLRKIYSRSRERNDDNMDAIDWESVRQATSAEIADALKDRGMNTVLAEEIKGYLDRAMRDHGSMDVEWLRDVPPKDAKEYLLSIHGIGLKSAECIRLLTLHHVAFPVDVNVGRVAVRLGWVPLQPLPGGLQMHLLQEYPVMDDIQKYLYPRLCTLSHEILYELHYHLITFGKIFCTKKKPRCDGCPLNGQCKHYASLSASKRLALPAPEIKKKSNVRDKPIVEMPRSPENHIEECDLPDIEDCYQDRKVSLPDRNETPYWHESDADFHKSNDDIPTIRINNKGCNSQNEISIHGGNKSHLVVQPGPKATPVPNYRGRLKSVHQVYELPDSHQILQQLQVDERDPKDPSPYLFVPWVVHEEGGKPRSSFPQGCSSSKVCREIVCYSTFSNNEDNDFSTTISGTLMIPVRSANKGRFALNGTYFQVNEVFADDESTNVPICVPKQCLSNLPLTLLFCGANVTSTFKELPMELIHGAFSRGYFCNRGFNRETRLTTKLSKLFHIKTNAQGKKTRQTKEEKTKQSGGA